MIIDARTLGPSAVVRAGVCIVGGGPAGLTLARELAAAGVDVCLLESGGVENDCTLQALNEGTTSGDGIQPTRETRHRRLGGTSHLWNSLWDGGPAGNIPGFRCGPLDEVDFQERPDVPHSGWPFGRAELDPFYARAHSACELGPYAYEAGAWERDGSPPLSLDSAAMTTDVWQFGPQAAFAGAGRDAVAAHRHVRVLVHATVQEIETRGDARHVTSLRAAVSGGGLLRVVAGRYVLAAGGIENARLLLLSDRVQKAGLGNAHDLVGRFFMEHQYVHAGTVRPRDRGIFERLALYDERRVDGTRILGKLHPTGATVRRESIPNFAAVVFPRHWFHERCRYDAVHSARVLVKGALRGQLPEGGLGHLRSFLSGLDYVAVSAVRAASGRRLLRHFVPGPVFISGAGWSEREEKRRAFSTFEVGLTTEQRPNADNRVMLTGERDEFGARRVHLHWRWRQADRDGVRRACEVLSRELENAGIGRLKIPAGGPQLVYPGLHHHMGTTRMHRDPRHGVVDENGRVHGVDNLFVAGCSVFPTGGYMNPTLTIVALAIRLADHLRAQLAASVPARVGAHASTVA